MVYKIKFFLRSPIYYNDKIHFDSLFEYYYLLKKNYTFLHLTQYSNEIINSIKLPINKIKFSNGIDFYLCSALFFSNKKSFMKIAFTKSRNNKDLLFYQKIQDNNRKPMKNKMIEETFVFPEYIYFYVSSNNIEEIEDTIKEIIAIGKYRKMGFGQIKNYKIIKTELDDINTIIKNNNPTRNIPKIIFKQPIQFNSTNIDNFKTPYLLNYTKIDCIIKGCILDKNFKLEDFIIC